MLIRGLRILEPQINEVEKIVQASVIIQRE